MTGDECFEVGSRVRIADGSDTAGVIVDDFGDTAGAEVTFEQRTVRGKRWAVRLDDGRLSFVDDGDIEPVAV